MMARTPVPATDLALAAVCVTLGWAELLVWHEWSAEPRLLQGVGMSVACAALALRRRYPLAAVLVGAAGTLLLTAGGTPPQILAVGLTGVVIAYSFAAALDGRRLLVALVAFATAFVVRDVADPEIDGFDIAIDAVVYLLPFAVGRVTRHRERRVELVARAADERAADAVRRERARIARELHDVVAHGLSVMVVQADAARHCLPPGDEETRDALAAIERTGRESLHEMRRLLGLLRDDEEPASLTPQPGLGAVSSLVETVRQAGLAVDLRIAGDVRPLPPGVDVAAYRIVQEALTNALRHAGPTRATVQISYDDEELGLRIADSGSTGGGAPGGNGLIGMRERALLYGGSFHAGPERGGFVVAASLPLAEPG